MKKRYNFSRKIVSEVKQKTGGLCFYCGEKLPPDTEYLDDGGKAVTGHRNWHIDHFVPLSNGGSNHISNLVPACIPCNSMKGAR